METPPFSAYPKIFVLQKRVAVEPYNKKNETSALKVLAFNGRRKESDKCHVQSNKLNNVSHQDREATRFFPSSPSYSEGIYFYNKTYTLTQMIAGMTIGI